MSSHVNPKRKIYESLARIGAVLSSAVRLEVLELLFGMAARLAAERMDEGKYRAQFRDCYEALVKLRHQQDTLDLLRARYRFYRMLSVAAGNSVLQEMLGGVRVHLLRVQLRSLHEDIVRERFDDYKAIAEAVLAGDARRAELAGRRHIRATSELLERLPVETGVRLSV